MAFFTIIQGAYEAVEKSVTQRDIQLALMHANYLDCIDPIRTYLQKCPTLQACANPLRLEQGTLDEVAHVRDSLCIETDVPSGWLFTCCPLSLYFKLYGTSEKLVELRKKIGKEHAWTPGELELYNKLFREWLNERVASLPAFNGDVWHWLSDQSPADSSVCMNLMALGLYAWGFVREHEPIIVLKWNWHGGPLRKPSWIDNGLKFYFDGAPKDDKSGWTRNLYNGKPGRREWVAKGGVLSHPVSATLVQADKRINCKLLPEEFWSESKARLLEHRVS